LALFFLTLKDEPRLRMLEDRKLRKLHEIKRKKVAARLEENTN
jgi:hypothetical protein